MRELYDAHEQRKEKNEGESELDNGLAAMAPYRSRHSPKA
jgi:hypothetical protein